MAATKDSLMLQASLQDPILLEAIISGTSLNIDASFEFLKVAAAKNPEIFLNIDIFLDIKVLAITNEKRYRELISIATDAKYGLEAQTANILEKSETIEDSKALPNVSNHHATTFGDSSSKKEKGKEKEEKDEVDNNDENKAKPPTRE